MRKNLLFRFIAVVAMLIPISAMSQTINSFPYSEDFESFATGGTSCTSTSALGNGWTNIGLRDWLPDANGTSSNPTGPQSGDHTTGGGKYLYTESSSPCSAGGPSNVWELMSPTIDLTGTNDIQFTFWWHAFGQSMGNLHIDLTSDGGATWTNDIVPSMTDNQDLWQQITVSLGAYTGLVNVRLRHEGNTSFWADMAVDDILIFDLLQNDAGVSAFTNPLVPTCTFNDSVSVDVTNFGTDTLTSATINWSWNGVPQTPIAWTGSIPPGGSLNTFLGTVVYAAGDDLSAWTSLPNGVVEIPSGNGNDTTSILGLQTGLSGIKTIGGTAPDYADFASAISDLNTFGVCGPVIFDIRDGVYNEQLTLTGLSSMDSTKTVTFRSENGDPSLVSLEYASSGSADNWVVSLDAAPHFRFENITLENTGTSFMRVFDFLGGNYDINVEGCNLIAPVTNSTSNLRCVIWSGNGTIDNGIHFMNNRIEGGSYGAYWYGTNSTTFEFDVVFDGNTFVDNYYRGLHLYYNNGAIIKDNVFEGTSAYNFRTAIYTFYATGAPQITGNIVRGAGTSGWDEGLYMSQGGGNNANHALIANNMFQTGWAGSTGTLYGMYLASSGYVDIYHNSVLCASGGSNSRALFATSGGEVEVMNNIFANYTAGYAIYAGNSFTISNSNHNVLYSPGGNIGFFGGAQQTLADWQNAAAFDANSIDYNPNFASSFDLHVCNDSIGNQGTPLSMITMDVDGQPRDAATPDMGADEFSGLSGSFLGSDIAVCTGDSVQLFAGSPSDTILWSTGDTTSTIWVSTPGSYTVSVQGACGSGTDAIVVSASAVNYAGYVAATDIEFCNGDSVILYSTQMADTYSWTGGSTNDSLTVTTGGTYTLDITDACGSGSEAITVTMNDVPTAAFTQSVSYFTTQFTDASMSSGNTTYAWDFGDGNTSTMQNPTHIYSNSGMYYATLTVTNDCGTMTFGDTVNIAIASIDELIANGDVSIYPNPSNGDFTIDMQVLAASNVTIRVENMLGALVHETTPTIVEGVYSETIELGNVEAGVYFVEVTAGDNTLVKKLVIE